jgi:hypothetical protein
MEFRQARRGIGYLGAEVGGALFDRGFERP